jgi:hypothetical protein
MDDFERELRGMLNDRVASMPEAFDAPPVLLKRARRRRASKLTALAASVVVVIGGAAGAIAQIAGGDGSRRVITTAPTSTVPRPGVPTVACARDYPGDFRGTRVLPPSRPRVPTVGDPTVLSTLVWFADSTDQNVIVLGPASWSCHWPVGEGGMVVYDPKATGGTVPTVDDAPILVENGSPWVDPGGARIACSVFDDAVVMEHVNARDISGCVHDRTPRRTVTRVDEHLATFVDDDGSRGVAWLQLPSSKTAYDGAVSVLRCRPTEGLTVAACDTIIAEYSARRVSEATVPTVECPSITDAGNERASTSTAPTTEPGGTSAAADQLPTFRFFSGGSDPRYGVLGPDSWSCLGRLTQYGSSMVVYDPNATPGQVPSVGAASIALQHDVWNSPSGARLLCSVFDDASVIEFTGRNHPDGCLTSPAPGRTVTRVSEDVATFVDANGDRGAGWMVPPSSQTQEYGKISVLTCRPSAVLTVATCDEIIADYAVRNSDGNPPPTSTTTATATKSATVATIVCPISYAVVGQTVVPPPTEPRMPAGGHSALFSHLASYAVTDDPRFVALGPAAWSCQGLMAADGDDGMVVYKTLTTSGAVPDIFAAPIAIENGNLWHGGVGSGTACSVFDDPAVVQYMTANFPQELPCPRAGRTVTRIDSHTSRFVDADGARGVGWIVLPSSQAVDDGRISVLTCRPTDGLTTADCDTIIADWIARNDTTG